MTAALQHSVNRRRFNLKLEHAKEVCIIVFWALLALMIILGVTQGVLRLVDTHSTTPNGAALDVDRAVQSGGLQIN